LQRALRVESVCPARSNGVTLNLMQTETGRPALRLVVDNTQEHPGNGATLAEKLIDYVGAPRGIRVVEFTYGPSRLGWRLQADGCRVDSIDLALYPIDSIPLEWMGQFDLAIVTCALHQVTQPDLLLADIVSCLRPGGVCGGVEPSHGDLAQLTLLSSAGSAGLARVDVSDLETSAAMFWKGHVPSLHVLPRPAQRLDDGPSFMPLAA
jgi:SAM-dependent methyltransferase